MYTVRLQFDQPREFEGIWWIPGKKARKVYGKLVYSLDGIRLDCNGELLRGMAFRNAPSEPFTIHGQFSQVEPVTLFDCRVGGWNFGAITTQSFRVSKAVGGMHIRKSHSLLVSDIFCQISHVNDWFGDGPFEHGWKSTRNSHDQISFTLSQTPVTVGESPNREFEFHIGLTYEQMGSGYSCSLNSNRVLTFHFRRPIEFQKAIKFAARLQVLFSMFTGNGCVLQSIEMTPCGKRKQLHRLPVLYQSYWRDGKAKYDQKLMPLPFELTRDNLCHAIARWDDTCEEIPAVINLLASSMYGRHAFMDDIFLALAQALEGYCRGTWADKYIDNLEFKSICRALKGALPKSLDENFRRKAESQIGFINDYSLRDRLLKLFERYAWLETVVRTKEDVRAQTDEIGQFVRTVVDARNSLTHVEIHTQRSRPADYEYSIIAKMRAVLILVLLDRIGVDPSKTIKNIWRGINLFEWWEPN